jgi:uncharacterized membrane protein
MGSLYWRSPLHPFFAAALLLGMGIWLVILFRRQRSQHSTRRTAALVLPKAAVALLLVMAYFDPVWKVVRNPDEARKIAVLVDGSSSMQVPDATEGTRAARSAQLLEELKDKLHPVIACDAYEFDREVKPYAGDRSTMDPIRETDLGASLMTMADKPDIAKYLGVVVITDGGDELIQNARLPEVPVYVAGVGSNPDGWDDIAIAGLDAPAVVETQSKFTVAAEVVIRRGSDRLAPKQTQAQVLLEERAGEGWLVRASGQIDLRLDRQRLELNAESPDQRGVRDYRLRIDPLDGELSALNNVRIFPVEIGRDKLPVLLFAQEVDWDFGTVRRELARDPSLALTTLYRISEDRFVIQDNRQEGDQVLEAGFPTEKKVLDLYKCIILGSFPASQWQAAQMQTLLEYVRQGGAVIFLGGGSSYASGGYGNTALEPLFPWRLDVGGRELHTGQFAVNVPVAATNHRIVAEMARSLARDSGPKIQSLNSTGPLRSGAVALLEANAGGGSMPVVALQHYGQGYCMAIATDTLWKWPKASQALKEAFRQFWRQAVRNVSQWQEGERFLSVRWDQPRYRPGERATAIIGVAGRYEAGQVHLKATLRVGRASPHDPSVASENGVPKRDEPRLGAQARPTKSEQSEVLDIAGALGSENEFSTSMVFRTRGEYTFDIKAFVGEKLLESYEKTLRVGPVLNEGAKLEVDHAFLDYLATQSGGAYFREGDFNKLVETLRGRVVEQAVTMDVPLVQYNYVYIIVLLIILACEWTLRRKMNLF